MEILTLCPYNPVTKHALLKSITLAKDFPKIRDLSMPSINSSGLSTIPFMD
jgi:hypothetical protein